MKKNGFTLAEVLITLGIIGVIATLTIPSFVSNSQNKANAAKLSATMTSFETAISNMMADESVADIYEIDDWSTKIQNYLKATVSDSTDAYPDNEIKLISGGTYQLESGKSIITKNGASIFVQANNKIIIDVAKGKPNIVGRDFFVFYLHEDGKLYPYGSKYLTTINSDYEYWNDSKNENYACNNDYKGPGCTGRLVENNFVVDY